MIQDLAQTGRVSRAIESDALIAAAVTRPQLDRLDYRLSRE